jgi:Helix-turn-helix domain
MVAAGVGSAACQPCLTTPAARERDRLEARRLRAAELFAAGVRQAEVPRWLGVSRQAVSVWYARWQTHGTDALRSRDRPGPGRGCPPAVGPHGAGAPGGRRRQRVCRGAVDAGPGRAGDRAADRGAPPSCLGVGAAALAAGLHSAAPQSVALPSATRPPSTAGSPSPGRGSSKRPTAQSLPGPPRRISAQPDAARPMPPQRCGGHGRARRRRGHRAAVSAPSGRAWCPAHGLVGPSA